MSCRRKIGTNPFPISGKLFVFYFVRKVRLMKNLSIVVVTVGLLLAFSSQAQAEGCLKGAVVGAAAGHVAHHAVMGAVAGCAVGHHMAKKQKEAEAKQQQK
jgi:hypothetical protein